MTKSTSLTIVAVYRPPARGTVTTGFCDAVSDLFDQLILSNKTFTELPCAETNVAGADDSSIDLQIENVLSRYNLVQHVH